MTPHEQMTVTELRAECAEWDRLLQRRRWRVDDVTLQMLSWRNVCQDWITKREHELEKWGVA